MHVAARRGRGVAQHRVVVEDRPGQLAARGPTGQVIADVPDPVDRPAQRRLVAPHVRGRVDGQVAHVAHVVQAAVHLERVVVEVVHQVVVEVERHRPLVPVLRRRILRPVGGVGQIRVGRVRAFGVAVGLVVDPVVEAFHVVVGHHVPRTVGLHRDVRAPLLVVGQRRVVAKARRRKAGRRRPGSWRTRRPTS